MSKASNMSDTREDEGEIRQQQGTSQQIMAALAKITERLDMLERRTTREATPPAMPPLETDPEAERRLRHPQRQPPPFEADPYYEPPALVRRDRAAPRRAQFPVRYGEPMQPRRYEDDQTNTIKMTIPPFKGTSDPNAYLEWESKVELVFDCHNYSQERKLKLAVASFCDYAIVWWDQNKLTRRRMREDYIMLWDDLKYVMRRRFVPTHYHRDLNLKLQSLKQGTRSVEEYYQEMELAMLRAEVDESDEATMARFVNGLNHEIFKVVELQPYRTLEEIVHNAKKVEKQLKRGSRTQPTTNWKKPWNSAEKAAQPKPPSKEIISKPYQQQEKGMASSNQPRNRDIKCFKCQGLGHIASQCPNKRVMIVLDSGEIASEEEEVVNDCNSESDVELAEGELALVVLRSLNVNTSPDESEEQRENIFYTRCKVQEKPCGLIIDGGSSVNVASQYMVDKLKLKTSKHPKPYRLQWLNESGELKVTK